MEKKMEHEPETGIVTGCVGVILWYSFGFQKEGALWGMSG